MQKQTSHKQYKSSLTIVSKTNFGTQLMLLLHVLHAGLVQKCFLLGGGGHGHGHGCLLMFWDLRVGTFSRWALIRR